MDHMDWNGQDLSPTMEQQSSQGQNCIPSRSAMSPSLSQSSQPSQLKWHNTIAEDFVAASLPLPIPIGRKRSSSIAFTDTSEAAYSFAGDDAFGRLAPSPLPSPTKRQKKTSVNGSFFITPVKAENPKTLTNGIAASASSGIQTPPPSTTSKTKKKGKQGKKAADVTALPLPVRGKEELPAATSSVEMTIKSFPSGFALPAQPHLAQTLPNGNHIQSIPMSAPVVSADFSPSKFWDSAMAEAAASEGMILGSGNDDINADIQSVIAQSGTAFDWSLLNTNPEDSPMFNLFGTPSKFNGMLQNADSKPNHTHVQATTDALNLSFLHDYSQADVQASPLAVNPNLIFSSRNIARNIFDDELGHLQPYRQQHLQQQQEQLEDFQKMQNMPLQQTLKLSGKPVLKRTQSESVLTRPSASKSMNQSNISVTLSKKTSSKSLIGNDENITPSPPTSAIERNSSPCRSSTTKRGQSRLRTLVNFSVSPGGRAKAEAIVIPEPDSESENFNPEETWEACESDSSTDVDEPQLAALLTRGRNRRSRTSTGRFADVNALHGPASQVSLSRPKLARFNTAPVGQRSSSRSTGFDPAMLETPTLARTLSSLPESSPTLPSPLKTRSTKVHKKKTPLKNGRRSSVSSSYSMMSTTSVTQAPSLSSMREESDQSEAETVVDEAEFAGDAIQALRRVVARRHSVAYALTSPLAARKVQGTNNSKHHIYSGSQSVQPKGYKGERMAPPDARFPVADTTFFTTPYSGPQDFFAGSFNVSPTTITDPDAVTPKKFISKVAGFKNGREEEIRCRCGVRENGRSAMIQCDTCSKWLHLRCESLTKKKVPNFFVCSFCSGEHSALKDRTHGLTALGSGKQKRRDNIPQSSPLARKVAVR